MIKYAAGALGAVTVAALFWYLSKEEEIDLDYKVYTLAKL